MKAILSFFDFWTIFCCFLIFLFIFALTFHKCQIVMRTGGQLQRPGKPMTADGELFVCVSVFFSFYESDSFIF